MPTREELLSWRTELSARYPDAVPRPPNLIGVGAARSGTTSLYHLLEHTPDIRMSPVKEIAYFSTRYDRMTDAEYLQFFLGGEAARFRGEISPQYLHSVEAPERIKALCGDCRIVIQLRNPVRRAVSHYRHHYSHHRNDDINAYFREGLERYHPDFQPLRFWHPVANMRHSFYHDAVQRYLDVFPAGTVKIIAFDDIVEQNRAVCADLAAWLDVELPRPTMPRVGSTKKKIGGGPLDPGIRRELASLFADDFAQTRQLTGIPAARLRQ
jgi:hypothetical protein